MIAGLHSMRRMYACANIHERQRYIDDKGGLGFAAYVSGSPGPVVLKRKLSSLASQGEESLSQRRPCFMLVAPGCCLTLLVLPWSIGRKTFAAVGCVEVNGFNLKITRTRPVGACCANALSFGCLVHRVLLVPTLQNYSSVRVGVRVIKVVLFLGSRCSIGILSSL